MDRWEEEFEDMFDVEAGSFEKMAKQYFKAGWYKAIQLMEDKLEGGFEYE
jgi:hypothetical protein